MGFDVASSVTNAARALTTRADTALSRLRTGADLTGSTLRQLTTPSGLVGVALETAWVGTHLALYPLGVATAQLRTTRLSGHYRTDDLPPRQRGLVVAAMEAATTPILLVHGIGDNRSIFTLLGTTLRRRGFSVVHAVNYSVLTALTGDIRAAATTLQRQVEHVCEVTDHDRVHIVGHSLGGMIARYYVQRLGGDARVDTLVTLGTPHQGTVAAYVLPTPVARQLRPNSDLINELALSAPGCRTTFVAIWSELDEAVVPHVNGRLDHPDLTVENHRLRNVGHLSLPVDPRARHLVVTALAHLSQPDEAEVATEAVKPHQQAPSVTG